MAQRESAQSKVAPSSFYQNFKSNPKVLNQIAFKSNFTPQIQPKQNILETYPSYNKQSVLKEGVNDDLNALELSNSNTSSTLNDQKHPKMNENVQK